MAHGRNAVCPVRSGKPDTQLAGRAEFRRRHRQRLETLAARHPAYADTRQPALAVCLVARQRRGHQRRHGLFPVSAGHDVGRQNLVQRTAGRPATPCRNTSLRRRRLPTVAQRRIFMGDGVGVRHLSAVLPAAPQTGRAVPYRPAHRLDYHHPLYAGVYRFLFRQPRHDSRPTEFDCIHRSDRHQQRAGDVSEPSGQQHAADGRIRHAELSRTYFTVRHRGTLAGRTARKQRPRRLRPDLAGPERDDS